ncbi:MAG: YebC/PmpR family DNA-binding transcriptional regulator [Bacteroidales bacterium]|jgi:YebC/PmpR family DNA-binding regulatory protein|nr:YebC/PmpR family DNA-binding transcriptional regulator [Bacteroidales bacterium]
MGRAFEFRKERKFKRWGNMARVFTRLGKEITIAAKSGGPDPDNNPRLRTLIQTARSENMPKDNIERAIKRASEKDKGDYKEVVYEGYGPHGIAFLIETATDNPTRTVANIRSYLNKAGGSLGTSGSVDFMFEHKCVFKMKSENPVDMEELELELIDYGGEEVFQEEDENINIYAPFESFGQIQKFIEDNGYTLVSGGFERIPTVELKRLGADERAGLEKLIEKLENDEDVQNVYHTMSLAE